MKTGQPDAAPYFFLHLSLNQLCRSKTRLKTFILTKMNKLLLCFLTVLLFIVACRKNHDEGTTPAVSGISGSIQPAGAVTNVTAFDSTTGKTYSAIPDSSGKFLISPLPPGYYLLSFAIDSPYAPSGIPSVAQVRAGETTDLGRLFFVANPSNTYADTATINGAVYPAGAFGEVGLTSSDGKQHYKATPDANGYFLFTQVLPAAYTLHFTVTDVALEAPGDSVISVSKNQVLQLGRFYARTKAGYHTSKIDTIVETTTYIDESVLLGRAPYDSLIVIQGNLTLFSDVSTDAMKEALNKITVITGYMDVLGDKAIQSITMNQLTTLGAFLTAVQDNLTSLSFPKLTSLTGLQLWNTPRLTSFQLGSLQQLSGMVSLIGTGLSDLSMFGTAVYQPFTLELEGNQNLTHISSLHFGSDSVYNLTITGNPLLSTLDGLQGITKAKNKITVSSNAALQTLEGMNNIANTDQLEIRDNPQLTAICAAKTVINAVKDRPTYTVRKMNPWGDWVTVTIDPFIASNDGSYATETDVTAAVAQCP